MAVTLKSVNGNRKLFRAYGELLAYLERYNGQPLEGTDPKKLCAMPGSRKKTTLKPIARLVQAIENERLN